MVIIESIEYGDTKLPFDDSIETLVRHVGEQGKFLYLTGDECTIDNVSQAIRQDDSNPLFLLYRGLSVPQHISFPYGPLGFLNWVLYDGAFWEHDIVDFLAEQSPGRLVVIMSATNTVDEQTSIPIEDAFKLPLEPKEFKPIKCKWTVYRPLNTFHVPKKTFSLFISRVCRKIITDGIFTPLTQAHLISSDKIQNLYRYVSD